MKQRRQEPLSGIPGWHRPKAVLLERGGLLWLRSFASCLWSLKGSFLLSWKPSSFLNFELTGGVGKWLAYHLLTASEYISDFCYFCSWFVQKWLHFKEQKESKLLKCRSWNPPVGQRWEEVSQAEAEVLSSMQLHRPGHLPGCPLPALQRLRLQAREPEAWHWLTPLAHGSLFLLGCAFAWAFSPRRILVAFCWPSFSHLCSQLPSCAPIASFALSYQERYNSQEMCFCILSIRMLFSCVCPFQWH